MAISLAGKTREKISQEAEARAREAAKLRAQGFKMAEVAERCGYASPGTCQTALSRWYRRAQTTHWQDVIIDRLESIVAGIFTELEREDLWVIERGQVVRNPDTKGFIRDSDKVCRLYRELRETCSEIAKLKGLYAPFKTVIEEVTRTMVREEMDRINAMAQSLEDELGEMTVPVGK